MKTRFILLLFLLQCSISYGQSRLRIGVSTGVDVGAAVPWSSSAISSDDKMRAVPHLTPSLGLMIGRDMNCGVSINAEANYKKVSLDATIVTLTQGQKFTDDSGEGVLFRGKATMSMSFTQLEVPIYVRYAINPRNAVILGGYYSYVINGNFVASPVQGVIQNINNPDADPAIFKMGDIPPQDFKSELSSYDLGWIAGYERKIIGGLSASGRFMMGLKDIFRPGENYLDYSMLQMRGVVMLQYKF